MRLNAIVDHAQFLFDTVGYLRFSAFYSPPNLSRGELVQKVARAVAGVFALLSLTDVFIRPLPFVVRLIVNGSLITLISSVAMSLLLKGVQKILNRFSEESELGEEEAETSDEVIFSKANVVPNNDRRESSGPFTPSPSPMLIDEDSEEWKERLAKVKRNLLPEFEKISKEIESHE
jgi:hypothetical protein